MNLPNLQKGDIDDPPNHPHMYKVGIQKCVCELRCNNIPVSYWIRMRRDVLYLYTTNCELAAWEISNPVSVTVIDWSSSSMNYRINLLDILLEVESSNGHETDNYRLNLLSKRRLLPGRVARRRVLYVRRLEDHHLHINLPVFMMWSTAQSQHDVPFMDVDISISYSDRAMSNDKVESNLFVSCRLQVYTVFAPAGTLLFVWFFCIFTI